MFQRIDNIKVSRHTRNCVDDIIGDMVDISLQLERTGFHGTKATKIIDRVAWIELFAHDLEAISKKLDPGDDLSGDLGNAIEVDGSGLVVRSEGDLEEGSGEIGVILTGDERSRFNDVDAGNQGRKRDDGEKEGK